ncbi:hypothetical protein [Leptolyngbya sp. NIES-2104]|uniref:hypothetical protein n=1 Tax=Leptolyngbya sp. NIES-2104 TaxID=1552121 RepID=UPI0006EC9E5C|nr:hypothetical protein [Leptolyngbya sp. NIES-2104]GAP94713.1 hypothetical protein NIES2104_12250 [Leptolyngbya sp. NIES-2104]
MRSAIALYIDADTEFVRRIFSLRLRLAPEWSSVLIVRSPLKGIRERVESDRTFVLKQEGRSL